MVSKTSRPFFTLVIFFLIAGSLKTDSRFFLCMSCVLRSHHTVHSTHETSVRSVSALILLSGEREMQSRVVTDWAVRQSKTKKSTRKFIEARKTTINTYH